MRKPTWRGKQRPMRKQYNNAGERRKEREGTRPCRQSRLVFKPPTSLEGSSTVGTSRFWCTRMFKYGPRVTVLVYSNVQVRSARHGFGVLERSSTVGALRLWCTRTFKYGPHVTVLVYSNVQVRSARGESAGFRLGFATGAAGAGSRGFEECGDTFRLTWEQF